MMNTQQPNYLADALWRRIADYPIDDPNAAKPLSAKLAEEQGWRPAFTARVLEEYKRFVYLCCISSTGASPSQIVDEAWHMHLTYTTDYWQRCCRDTLQQELHHHPSMGGPEEYQKHRKWYFDTLRLYLDTFSEYPPEDIWPGSELVQPQKEKQDMFATRLSKSRYLALLIPVLIISALYKQPNPFGLAGPHFLVFFTFFCISSGLLAANLLAEKSKLLAELIKVDYPYYSKYERAYLPGDYARVALLLVVELVDSGAITTKEDGVYDLHRDKLCEAGTPLAKELIELDQSTIGTTVLKDMATQAAGQMIFAATALRDQYEQSRASYFVLPAFTIILAICRMAQGIYNDKPIGALIVLTIVYTLAVALVYKVYAFHHMCSTIYKAEVALPSGETASTSDLVTIYGIAAIVALPGYSHMNDLYNKREYGGSCGGGCSSGGCGGGGCGGGCGGCGGS
jgi:uncharacterized protein (TIGR04222 family)